MIARSSCLGGSWLVAVCVAPRPLCPTFHSHFGATGQPTKGPPVEQARKALPGVSVAMGKPTARAKAAAEKQREEQEKKRKIAEAKTLVDKQDIQEGSTKKRQRATKEVVDERMISKIIRDNFKGWSSELCELNIRDGLSLRARLTRDKNLQVSGKSNLTMGKLYYSELRSIYGAALSPEQLLIIRNDEEPVDLRLSAAMEGMFARKKSFEKIMSYLGCADMVSQKNLVALFKACLMLSPATTQDNNALALALLDFCRRHNMQAVYPEETGVMKSYFQSALVKAFLEFRKHELSRMDYWLKFKEVLHFVLPVASAEKCFTCSGKWGDVESHLALVVQSGELGRLLFGRAWGEVSRDKVTKVIKTQVDDLFVKTKIGSKDLQDKLREVTMKVRELGRDISDVFPEPRRISISFLGASVDVEASSSLEEYDILVWSRIKEWGISRAKVASIWGEHCLLDAKKLTAFPDGFEVEVDVLGQLGASRKVAASYLKDKEVNSMNVASALVEHGGFLTQMDKRFRVEKAYFEHMSDSGALNRMKSTLIDCMPSAPGESASDCSGRLATVVQGDLYKWVGLGGQSLATSVLELVRTLAANKAPQFHNANDHCFEECRRRCAFFVSLQVPGEAEGAMVTVFGKNAVEHLLKGAEAKLAEGEPVVYGDISKAMAFAWLLDDANRKKLNTVVSQAASANDEAPTSSSTSAAKGKKTKKESSKQMVANLFKSGGKGR